jgi:hypothetical protein
MPGSPIRVSAWRGPVMMREASTDRDRGRELRATARATARYGDTMPSTPVSPTPPCHDRNSEPSSAAEQVPVRELDDLVRRSEHVLRRRPIARHGQDQQAPQDRLSGLGPAARCCHRPSDRQGRGRLK